MRAFEGFYTEQVSTIGYNIWVHVKIRGPLKLVFSGWFPAEVKRLMPVPDESKGTKYNKYVPYLFSTPPNNSI